MFLHIGANVEVRKKDIVAIIDIETGLNTSDEFWKNAKDSQMIINISKDNPKSIILLENNQKTEIYLSPISSATLQKRVNFLQSNGNSKR